MSDIKFINADCMGYMDEMLNDNKMVDLILTSPPYNTGRPSTSVRSRNNHEGRYDVHIDNMSTEEYCNWCVELFNKFDKILNNNGVILWNVSYSSDVTVNRDGVDCMWLSIADILRHTNFTIADKITWKKKNALPNNVSPNKLTRICEEVFVFCRKSEYKTFNCNKDISCIGKNGQTFYKTYYNFIEAPNNDGKCDLNKATFSSDLCLQLLNIYANNNTVVFDPFNGTGTTGIACYKMGLDYIGTEISQAQIEYSKERLRNYMHI